MNTNFTKFVTFFCVLGLILFLSACSIDRSNGNSADNSSNVTKKCAVAPCEPEKKLPIKQIVCKNPVKVAAMFDQSGSMKWSGTAAITPDDLRPLLELTANCGGELGVTLVRSDSAKAIERFPVSEPPPMPVKPVQNADEEDYEFADRMVEYEQSLFYHSDSVRQKRSDLQPQIDEYLKILAPLLAKKPSGATDFSGALNRLSVFLEEGDAVWKVKPHRYLIIVSDAEDTAGKTKSSFKADATVFWVNATAPDKAMKDFPYKRFESFQSTVAEIIAIEGEK